VSPWISAITAGTAKVASIEGDEAVVEVFNGDRLRAPADWVKQANVGSEVTLVVRPEDIRVDLPASVGNALTGTLRQTSYFGSHRELVVRVGGEDIKVQAPKGYDEGVGHEVVVHVPRHALRILPGSDEGELGEAPDAVYKAAAGSTALV